MTDKSALIQPDRGQPATALHLVNKAGFADWLRTLSAGQRAAIEAQKFEGGGYETAIVPDGDGWFAVGGVADPAQLSSWCLAKLAEVLPEGTYRMAQGSPGQRLFFCLNHVQADALQQHQCLAQCGDASRVFLAGRSDQLHFGGAESEKPLSGHQDSGADPRYRIEPAIERHENERRDPGDRGRAGPDVLEEEPGRKGGRAPG